MCNFIRRFALLANVLTALFILLLVTSCGGSAATGSSNAGGGQTTVDVGTVEEVSSTWSAMFGTASAEGEGIVATSANRVALAGYSIPRSSEALSTAQFDGILAVYDIDGNLLWSDTLQSTVSLTSAFPQVEIADLLYGSDGTLYVAGSTEYELDAATYRKFDGFVRAYADDGSVLWAESFRTRDASTQAINEDFVMGIALRNDETQLVVYGETEGEMHGEAQLDDRTLENNDEDTNDLFVTVLDVDTRATVWTTQFGTPVEDAAATRSLGVLSDGQIVVASRSFAPSPGHTLTFLSEDGSVVQSIDIEQTAGLEDPIVDGFIATGRGLAVSNDDSIHYLARTFGVLQGSGVPSYDVTLITYESDGSHAWTRHTGSENSDDAKGLAVHPSNGSIHIAGAVLGDLVREPEGNNFDAFVQSFDASGNVLATTQFGTDVSEWASVAFTPSGARVLSGGTSGTLFGRTSAGGVDLYVTYESP